MTTSSTLFSFSLLLLIFLISGGIITKVNGQEQKRWCIAKPSTNEAALLENINYACSKVDCSVIHKGCTCFYPDNLINHASVAMNLYYRAMGANYWNCDFKASGLTVITNPSYDNCVYA
ncbi:hypothetical protein RND81_09G005000 [Saponaria officinalis]|uniref:X8 domain-containing protein n=1 Tax=Saponaria officinalis TaxID=3572 RepID=A0AAW1IH70_SAPOF